MKTISNAVLAGLIVAALFWGNCFTCPQFLLSVAQKSAHGCCSRSAPPKAQCATSVLKHFVKADLLSMKMPAQAPQPVSLLVPTPAAQEFSATAANFHSPPDVVQQHTTLRI
jgi:hypothetical protein